MIYELVDIYGDTVVEIDELHDEVTERTIIAAAVNSKFTEWNASDIKVQGREFTLSHRKVLLKIDKQLIKDAQYVVKGSELFKIEKLVDLQKRWTLAYVKRYRA